MVIDDENSILVLLYTVLKKEGFTNIKVSTDSISAVEICKKYNPDIIILDIMMPNMNGFDVFKKISTFMDVPILFLSAKSDEVDKILGLGLGADDYITKPFSPKEVALRVTSHLKRIEKTKSYLNTKIDIFKTKDFVINFSKGEIIRKEIKYTLRAKELKLLSTLVFNRNIILSKEKLIETVWQENFDGYSNTLMVHIRKLREKLETNPSNPKYIETVKGIGYKFNA